MVAEPGSYRPLPPSALYLTRMNGAARRRTVGST